jgi:hypothetical protein
VTHECFARDFRKDYEKLIRKGIPADGARRFIDSFLTGLNSQTYNAPIDLFIEYRLYQHRPALHPVQFLSLRGMLADYVQAANLGDTAIP